jgi:2-(3-amino-3-carboxypropyl)histidine synthase
MFEEYSDEINEKNAKRIAIQLPSGLKRKAPEILAELQKIVGEEVELLVLGDTSYGACDLRDIEAEKIGADLMIHFGHASFGVKEVLPTIYIEFFSDQDISPVVEKAAREIKEERIGLLSVVQFTKQIEKAQKILEKAGKKVIVGQSQSRSKHAGQILGCDFTAGTSMEKDIDCFLYIGTGDFHPAGVAMGTKKIVYVADPERNEIRDMEELKDKLLRVRFAKIEAAKKAKRFGIIVSPKGGQNRLPYARKVASLLQKFGKEAFIVVVDEITPQKLDEFMFDYWVCTACSRIAYDDEAVYKKMITPQEVEIVTGNREWKDYVVDHF